VERDWLKYSGYASAELLEQVIRRDIASVDTKEFHEYAAGNSVCDLSDVNKTAED
jgi:hypothetical protein